MADYLANGKLDGLSAEETMEKWLEAHRHK